MALIIKTAPKGVDAKIDQLQRYLYTKLSWVSYESYHRGYRNPKEGNFIPEVYTANGEYEEVFFNDGFSATSYFLVDEENPIEKKGIKATVSLYYQVKLDQIKPTISHRADEEVLNEVLYWINRAGFGIKSESVITGIPNVYSGLKQDQVTFDDMSNFFVFRIILDFPIIMPDFCPGVIVPVCPQDIFLKAIFGAGNSTMETLTIDADNAGIYTSITDDGASGDITLDYNGGGFVAFSTLNPLTLSVGDTLVIKRTVTTSTGFAKLTGTYV